MPGSLRARGKPPNSCGRDGVRPARVALSEAPAPGAVVISVHASQLVVIATRIDRGGCSRNLAPRIWGTGWPVPGSCNYKLSKARVRPRPAVSATNPALEGDGEPSETGFGVYSQPKGPRRGGPPAGAIIPAYRPARVQGGRRPGSALRSSPGRRRGTCRTLCRSPPWFGSPSRREQS